MIVVDDTMRIINETIKNLYKKTEELRNKISLLDYKLYTDKDRFQITLGEYEKLERDYFSLKKEEDICINNLSCLTKLREDIFNLKRD